MSYPEEWTKTDELRFIKDKSFKGDPDFAPKILQQKYIRRIFDAPIPTKVGDSRNLLGMEEKWQNVPLVEE